MFELQSLALFDNGINLGCAVVMPRFHIGARWFDDIV